MSNNTIEHFKNLLKIGKWEDWKVPYETRHSEEEITINGWGVRFKLDIIFFYKREVSFTDESGRDLVEDVLKNISCHVDVLNVYDSNDEELNLDIKSRDEVNNIICKIIKSNY